jgi:tRNA A37 threonylcarbamoyladenosine biosynthesis protein TsaE
MEASLQLPFPAATLKPILKVLQGPRRMTVLAGGVGSGKLTALQQVAGALGLRVSVHFLEYEVNLENLEARLLRALQPTLEGATVVAVRGAELIQRSAMQRLAALELAVHCVLLTNEKLDDVPRERVLYHPQPSEDFCWDLAAKLGAKSPAVVCLTAKRDLRQVAVLVQQEKAAGVGVGATDAAPHAWRDTRAVLGGASVPEERLCIDYVEGNALAGMPGVRLEEAAAMYDALSQLDAAGALPRGSGDRRDSEHFPEGAGTGSAAAMLAVRGARRGLPWLKHLDAPRSHTAELLGGAGPFNARRPDLGSFCFEAPAGSEAAASPDASGKSEECRPSPPTAAEDASPGQAVAVGAPSPDAGVAASVAASPFPAPGEAHTETSRDTFEESGEVLPSPSTGPEETSPEAADPSEAMEVDSVAGQSFSSPASSESGPAEGETVREIGGSRFVACPAVPRPARAAAAGKLADAELRQHFEETRNQLGRRMRMLVLTALAEGELSEAAGAWRRLAEQLPGGATSCLWRVTFGAGAPLCVALVFKSADTIVRAESWTVWKLRRPDPVPLARALEGFERVGTMELAASTALGLRPQARVSARAAGEHLAQHCGSKEQLQAYLIDVAEKKERGDPDDRPTPMEEFILRHKRDMKDYAQSVRERESLRALLCEVALARRFPWDFDLSSARAWYADSNLSVRMARPAENASAILKMAVERTVVFYGPPGAGKTECARALAALMAKSRGVPSFVFVNAVDALRKLSDHGLLEPGAPILLDEFRPRTSACGAQGGGGDHLKNVVDSTHTKTIEAQFNDFALPWDSPRILTKQDRRGPP